MLAKYKLFLTIPLFQRFHLIFLDIDLSDGPGNKMIDTVPVPEEVAFAVQLKALLDQEARYQPKLCGLRLIESAQENGLRMTARLRDFEVKDLLSLTRFFGFSADTFSLAVSLLDRFLSVMKIQPKHLSCIGLCCFYIAAKSPSPSAEEEGEESVPSPGDLIRISQSRFTTSDMTRMEKIVLEKLRWKVRAPTAVHFLRLCHSFVLPQLHPDSKKSLSIERLEAQLKACHCCFAFTKIKPSLLALGILALEVQQQGLCELSQSLESLQLQFHIKSGDLVCVRELVGKCLMEYSLAKGSRPGGRRLRWTISGRTARQLKRSCYKIAHLPTIPEVAS